MKYYYLLHKGGSYFKKIMKKRTKRDLLLIPHDGLGDSYNICRFIKYYSDSFDLVIIGKGNQKICRMFDITNVIVVDSQRTMDLICHYVNFNPHKNVKIIHYDHTNLNPNCNILSNIRGLYGLTYTEMIRDLVLQLNASITPVQPHFDGTIINYEKLKQKRSVLISPLASSMEIGDETLWVTIVNILKERNYLVYTNVTSESDYVVPGTEGLFIPLESLVPTLDYMGMFIGTRSGLCDVISTSKCKKIILYPEWWWGMTTAYAYFNMKKMGLVKEDILEIDMINLDNESIVNEILHYI